MAWTPYQQMLTLLLVVTGTINTISNKWADNIRSVGSDGKERAFQHPFLQATTMFMGEMLCLLVFKLLVCGFSGRPSISPRVEGLIQGNRAFSPFYLAPPALLDMCGTSIMYVGLNLTYASSFQMFRGSLIVFVAMLSVFFLDRKILTREWCGIGAIIVGLLVVGASDFTNKDPNQAYGPNSIITGDLLIVLAQVITAFQMVYEEKYVTGRDIAPLQAVGWEGIFGFSALIILQTAFYFIPAPYPFNNNARGTVEDAIDGLVQIGNSNLLLLSVLGGMVSIPFFNFAGISLTKEFSATTRMVLDTVRTLIIWVISLGVGWQTFHWPQLLGFGILLIGMCIYNNILIDRIHFRRPQAEPIINYQDAIEEQADT